ncbi:serine/threonine/dual specificity protein kinase, catalytic domain-containing protein [Artemisia annua]|uniref:Serine/threonine/dual specificity protein kinase, catalytic domain-containing protein n=1 Tax=Artemisia annua TaxID=35608 RepID=A0A2U1QEV2_ARTAN|nr:serine/threonine/dual specificity protein kinase, catalytic domain-containing protein [Artemisia annua]
MEFSAEYCLLYLMLKVCHFDLVYHDAGLKKLDSSHLQRFRDKLYQSCFLVVIVFFMPRVEEVGYITPTDSVLDVGTTFAVRRIVQGHAKWLSWFMGVSTQSTSSIIMFLATGDGKESEPSSSSSPACRHFDLPEIQLATENFNESLVVGEGGFGKVYKGTIHNGSTLVQVAIKRLGSSSGQGERYCKNKNEMALVYEYMPKGTLSDHLHKLCTPLSWLQRLKICIGAARGLHYLHTEQWSLSTWALEGIEAGHLRQIIDSDIKDQIPPKCLKEFVGIARRCLHSNPKKRPTIAEVLVSLESIMILQEKTNHSWQAADRTIFGKMVNLLHFPSDGENSAHRNSKLSSKSESNSTSASNTLMGTREVLEDLRIPNPSLKVIDYTVLESATRNFNPDLRLAKGGFGEAFIGWVDKNTFCASTDGVGIAVTVKKRNHNSVPGHAKWLMQSSHFRGEHGLV